MGAKQPKYPIGTPVDVRWGTKDDPYTSKGMQELYDFLRTSPKCTIGDVSKDPRPNVKAASTWPHHSYIAFEKPFEDSEGRLNVPGVMVLNLKITKKEV